MSLAAPTCEDFATQVGSVFRIIGTQQTYLALTLIEATPAGSSSPRAFSLVFRSAIAQALPQNLYALDHDAMGRLDLFLVPLRRTQSGVDYVATFN